MYISDMLSEPVVILFGFSKLKNMRSNLDNRAVDKLIFSMGDAFGCRICTAD